MKKILGLIKKYRSLIAYGVFGVLTTLVNIGIYYLCYEKAGMSNTLSNICAWTVAVLFAYLTNKVWVFESHSWKWADLKREVVSFMGCRMATGVMDLFIMYICVDLMHWHATLMKVLSNVLVIILNYVFSKLVIFKQK